MKIEFICHNEVELPKPSTELSGAVDLQARGIMQWYTANNVALTKEQLKDANWRFKNNKPIRLLKGQRILIDTDLQLANCPHNFKGDVKSRSGLALKHGVYVLNADGLIDADYRLNIGVILSNTSNEAFEILFNDKIAQFECRKGSKTEFIQVDKITEPQSYIESKDISKRKGGFGSTGVRVTSVTRQMIEKLEDE